MTLTEEYKQVSLICNAVNIYRADCMKEDNLEYDNEEEKEIAQNITTELIATCDAILERAHCRQKEIESYFKEAKEFFKKELTEAKEEAIKAINKIEVIK